MPYISESRREPLGRFVYYIDEIETPGELNFCISQLALEYIEQNGECYQTYNDVLGALEGAKLELYRRKIAPYEDKKIQENGDVW